MQQPIDFDTFIATISRTNPGVRVCESKAGHEVYVGLGDKNFAPLTVLFNPQGLALRVDYPNTNVGFGGSTRLKPDPKLLATVAKMGASLKGGVTCGSAMAALARAAGAQTPGTTTWGTGYGPLPPLSTRQPTKAR